LSRRIARGLLGVEPEQLRKDVGERVSPALRGEEVQLGRARRIGAVQQLREGRKLERLPNRLGRAGDVRDRQREIGVDIRVHVREPAGVGERQEQVAVAEAAMDLHREWRARLLVRLEGGPERMVVVQAEPAAIGRDGLERRESFLAGRRNLRRIVRLEPQDRQRPAAGELAHPPPVGPLPRRREAVIDEQDLGPGRAQERGRVLVRVRRQPHLQNCLLPRVASELLGQLCDSAPVRRLRGHVRPLARIRALREEPAELVEARRRAREDPVRVVVDEADRA